MPTAAQFCCSTHLLCAKSFLPNANWYSARRISVVVFTRSHQTSQKPSTTWALFAHRLDRRKPLKSSTVFSKSYYFFFPFRSLLLLGLMLWLLVLRWCLSDNRVFFSLSLSNKPNCCGRSLCLSLGLAAAPKSWKGNTKKPPEPFSLSLARLCFYPSLQQTILKHARVRSDEFGGRHRVTSRLCALLSIPLFVRDSASSTTIAFPIVWLAQPLRRPIVNCNHLEEK